MQLPIKCPKCNKKIEYISDVHLIPNTNPQEAGIEGSCFNCQSIIYSKFKVYEIEFITFNNDGSETEVKLV